VLIHFVQDEFLELELDGPRERLRLAEALGLDKVDLSNCTVFVNFSRNPLTAENRRDTIHAAREHELAERDSSLELFPT